MSPTDATRDAICDLGDLAWEWDPIGLGKDARPFAVGEYHCIVETVVPLLARRAPIDEIVRVLAEFIRADMGFIPSEEDVRSFAESATSRWSRL